MIIMGQAVGKGIESVMIIHDYYTVLAIMSGAGFIGVLVFGSSISTAHHMHSSINVLKVLAFTAVASAFLIEITGTIGYIEYRQPDPDSAKSKILEVFPFAHAPMFESMEYVGLVGTMWTGLVAYLTWHFKERMFSDAGVKNLLIVLISLAIFYALFVSLMGIVPTKIASVQG
jgi:phosphoglycerol transferase MdoB-like AlkP superfamily enzyme